RFGIDQPARDLESRQPRHLDVEEHDVRLETGDRLDGLDAVPCRANDVDAADLAELKCQLVACELLVVHEHCGEPFALSPQPNALGPLPFALCQAVTRSAIAISGISMLTDVPWPGTLDSRSA